MTALVVAALLACARPAPEAEREPQAALPAAPATSSLFEALRRDTLLSATDFSGAVRALRASARRRDLEAARGEFANARGRERALTPLIGRMASRSTARLEPDDDAPEGAAPVVGVRDIGRAIAAETVDWPALDRALDALVESSDGLVTELADAAWTPQNVGQALSDGVYEFGAHLDGSASVSDDDLGTDTSAEGLAIVHYARTLADAARSDDAQCAAALDERLATLERFLSRSGERPRDVLDALRATARVGAAVRAGARALGAPRVDPPFTPFAGPLDEVSVATFPAPAWAPASEALVALGRAYFDSPLLSADGRMRCRSCHEPARGFSAGAVRPRTVAGTPVGRDPLSVIGAANEIDFFWDGVAPSLEAQIDRAVARDMAGRWPEIAARVGADPALSPAARAVFGRAASPSDIKAAIVAYERTLLGADTPFDRYVRGDDAALDARSRAGFDLFYGKAHCSHCHLLPLTSGVIAPRFSRAEFAAIGVPASPSGHEPDHDPGRARVTGNPEDQGRFKVPTLRGVGATAPYFHNGGFPTLAEVVDFYAEGGGLALGLDPRSLDPDLTRLSLDAREREDLVAFLRDGLAVSVE